jgi:ribosomal protein S18 acetylase RimI-like enzyme
VSEQQARPVPRSLVWATHLDVMALDSTVERRDGYLAVRSPSNPTFYWGNFLLFDEPPDAGDGERWERAFENEFVDEPRVRHRTFAWDRADGAFGLAPEELPPRGYELEEYVGLVARHDQVTAHPRGNSDVVIRALEPAPGLDEGLWAAAVELQVANRDAHSAEESHRVFTRARQAELRAHFKLGRGTWYLARDPASGEVVAGCGIVVTGERARFQAVVTAHDHRQKGICSRLVVEAADHAAATYGAERFVIVADAAYHALGLYESLGFARSERVVEAVRRPSDEDS